MRKFRASGLSGPMATLVLILITLTLGVATYAYIINDTSAATENVTNDVVNTVNSAAGGLQNGFHATALVSANVVSCIDNSGLCTILLKNVGGANAQVKGCFFSGVKGGTGTLAPNLGKIRAGRSVQVTCASPRGHGTGIGSQAAGSIHLDTGEDVEWATNWQ